MNEKEKGYLSDPLSGDFTATVRRAESGAGGTTKVWLDRTLFYPESGGQPEDRGTLGGFEVKSVSENEHGVCHVVAGRLEEGASVEGRVDMARRFDHMQQHTGQHILSRAFVSIGGLLTVGFHLGEKASTIDLGGAAGEAIVSGAEREANAVVYQDLPVEARIFTRDEYDSLEGKDGGLRSRVPGEVEQVRIVEIADMDSSTCCGTHCPSTGMVGIIKITGTERVRGGTRVEFLCGGRALGDYAEKHETLTSLGASLSTDWRELREITGKLVAENKSLRKERDGLSRELAGYRVEEMSGPTGSIAGHGLVRKVFETADTAQVREMANRIKEAGGAVVLFAIVAPKPALIFACDPEIGADMGAALRTAAELIGGRGGGAEDFAQGGGGDPSMIEQALDAAERQIEEMLK